MDHRRGSCNHARIVFSVRILALRILLATMDGRPFRLAQKATVTITCRGVLTTDTHPTLS